jgi:hypothetical protein
MNKKHILKSLKVYGLIVIVMSFVLCQSMAYANDVAVVNTDIKIQTDASGSVVDITSGQKCVNATIKYISNDGKTTKTIMTDKNGDFKIDKLDTGFYNYYIECEGYQKGSYLSYPVISGGNIYKFEISKTQVIANTFIHQSQTEGAPGAPLSFSEVLNKLSLKNGLMSPMQSYNTSAPTPYIPTNIRVRRANGQIETVPLETYISRVVPREIGEKMVGMTNDQILKAFKVQAIAARGYAVYNYYNASQHPGTNYDVCDSTHCQVYDPTYTTTLATQAVNETAKQIPALVSGTQYNWNIYYVQACFFNSCAGQTKNVHDVWGYYLSYLVSVSCPYDPTKFALGDDGHGVGLCQDGAVGYVKNGWDYCNIIMHYYTGVTIVLGQYT